MIHIGTTGSKKGPMSQAQVEGFEWLMLDFLGLDDDTEFTFHHGDCIGWDAWVHDWVKLNFPFTSVTHAHPGHGVGFDQSKRAYTKSDIVEPVIGYADRNNQIAFRATYCLIAGPETTQEMMRSGTWATVRAAYTMNQAKLTDKYSDRPIYIVQPRDGMVVPFTGTVLSAPKGLLTEDQRSLFAI